MKVASGVSAALKPPAGWPSSSMVTSMLSWLPYRKSIAGGGDSKATVECKRRTGEKTGNNNPAGNEGQEAIFHELFSSAPVAQNIWSDLI